MTPAFAARRRAEEFNSLVESASTEELQATQYADQLEIVGALRETAPAEPRPEFVSDLRRQLMAEAATVLTPTAAKLTLRPRRTSRERRIAVAVGGFAVVSATTSMAMAAQSALPGDTLYPLKRAMEDASTTIRADEDAKGATLLDHASGRLEEVDELTQRSEDTDAGAVADTLHAFSDQARKASDLLVAAYSEEGQEGAIEQLRAFTSDSMGTLTNLESVVPEDARPALIEATQVVTLISSEAVELCPTCGGGVAEMPEFAAASVPGLLDALGAPTGLLDQDDPREPDRPVKDQPADAKPDPKQGDPAPNQQGSPIPGPGAGGGDTSTGDNDAGDNPIDQLTDGLTGGAKDPEQPQDPEDPDDPEDPKDPDTGGLGGTLQDTVDGVGGLLGGLLGG